MKDQSQYIAECNQRIAELEAEVKRHRPRRGRVRRAYSPTEVLAMKRPSFPFTGAWEASLGRPATSGIWIVWGRPGNGKSSFVMQLAKYLCKFGKVIYDSLEESTGLSFQKSLRRHGMGDVAGRFIILDREPMDALRGRLSRKKSPNVVIIDSLQYSGLTYNGFKQLKEDYPWKLFIFISHAAGLHPEGRVGGKVEYDADIKIFVEGFKASCKSRFMDRPGVPFIIWDEGAIKYALGEPGEGKEVSDE